MKNYVILFIFLINFSNGVESNPQKKSLKVFVIPGQNGLGLDKNYVTQATGISPKNIHRVKTPTGYLSVDLGQSGCTKHLKDALKNNKDNFIVYANSQGTATALNFFSENPQYKDKCKGMVLEAVLGSGNSAIYHTCHSIMDQLNIPALKKIPGLYYLAPYFAKALFPTHSPGGDQPIKSVENLDIDGPIIIAHSRNDLQLSHKDARAIYYALRQKKEDVYLISKEGRKHINLLQQENVHLFSKRGGEYISFLPLTQDPSVRNILAHHGIAPKQKHKNKLDIRRYQPDPKDHKAAYDELITKERKHKWIRRGLWTTPFMVACGIAKKLR